MKKRQTGFIIGFLLLNLVIGTFTTIVYADDTTFTTDFDVQAKAAIAIDSESGKIFYEKNATEALPIASMTKLLTMYLVLEAIHNKELGWDEKVTINDHLYELSQDMELSNVPFEKNGTYTVKDLFNATEVVSANAAAVALAEKIAGSEKDFVDRMRAKVKEWQLDDAYLISTSGINNEDAKGQIYPGSQPKDENKMSAKSMAIVARHLIHDYPEFLEYSKKSSDIFAKGTANEIPMSNWNMMLPGMPYEKAGVDGLKTGTTLLAGACFVGTIKQDNLRLITVVMNADNWEQDNGVRFKETANLMDYVYNNWEQEMLIHKGDAIPDFPVVSVNKGKELTVPIKINQDLTFWTEKNMPTKHLTYTLNMDTQNTKNQPAVYAPIQKNTEVGNVTVQLAEDTLGYLDTPKQVQKASVIVTNSVEKANPFVLLGRKIKHFIQSF